jgi:hypothetical protein
MKNAAVEISRISESLSPRKTAQLLNYARRLAAPTRPKAKKTLDGDAEWERIINDPRRRPKLEAKLKEVDQLIATGKTMPLNPDRM